MTSPLVRLRDAIVAGTRPYPYWGAAGDGVKPTICGIDADAWKHLGPAFDGSVDAALAFKDAVLPGWGWTAGTARPDNHFGKVWSPDHIGKAPVGAINNDPARALLLACLAALIEKDAE